jgi:hypothetical protein
MAQTNGGGWTKCFTQIQVVLETVKHFGKLKDIKVYRG